MMPTLLAVALAVLPAEGNPDPGSREAILLDDYGPCGPTSLFLVCKIREIPVEWDLLKEVVGPPGADGMHSFADLARAATSLGLYPVGLRTDRASLNGLPMPAIVQVHDPREPDAPPHLLVLVRTEPDGVTVLDPPFPAYFLPESRFATAWTGYALIFARDEVEAARIRWDARANQVLWIALWCVGIACGLAGLAFFARWPLWGTGGRLRAIVEALRAAPLRYVVAACLAIGLLAAGYWYRFAHSEAGAPRCIFDSPAIELGELAPGQLDYPVKIHNKGTQPLRITGTLSNCSCAAVKGPGEIAAGEVGTLLVTLHIPPGPRSARLTVESNDPQGPKTVILSWHGKAEPRLVPFKLDDQAVAANRPYERTVLLVYPGGKSALLPRLESCQCDSPLVEVQAGKSDPLASRFARSGILTQALGETKLEVKVRPPDSPGMVTAKCTLSLKYGEKAMSLVLPVSLRFTDQTLDLTPASVVFSAVSPEELKGQVRTIHVKAPASGLALHDVPAWMEGETLPQAGGEAAIRLRVKAAPPMQLIHQTLQVAHGPDKSLRVPLRVSAFAPGR